MHPREIIQRRVKLMIIITISTHRAFMGVTYILIDLIILTNECQRGMSLWWQVLNPSGVGVGLWAQINFNDSYTGAGGNYFRDDQDSLLNVVISNVD